MNDKSDLIQLIKEIGVERFVGRINSGFIDPSIGYDALEMYTKITLANVHYEEPSWFQRLLDWWQRRKK
jgi:hypothetical protein